VTYPTGYHDHYWQTEGSHASLKFGRPSGIAVGVCGKGSSAVNGLCASVNSGFLPKIKVTAVPMLRDLAGVTGVFCILIRSGRDAESVVGSGLETYRYKHAATNMPLQTCRSYGAGGAVADRCYKHTAPTERGAGGLRSCDSLGGP